MPVKNLVGQRFGKLLVLERDITIKSRKSHWICMCECGNKKTVRGDSLGKIRSCGCIKKEQDKINLTKHHSHKLSKTRIYHIFQGMKTRCYNPNNKRYDRYGGRGIVVCDQWKDDPKSFFDWAFNNGYQEHLTIDRVDNNGNYEPRNCQWSDSKTQSRNRSTNVVVDYQGEKITLMELSESISIPYSVLYTRYKRAGDRGERLIRPIENVWKYRDN